MLDVGEGHRLHVERAGSRRGAGLVWLHGGPGSGSSERQRQWFEGRTWNAWLFDQRGAGRSTPGGGIDANDTDRLVADIERVREHAGLERWLVAGGSWGTALALAYARRHPERVDGLLLRAAFLTGQADLDWFFDGAGAFVPQAYARLGKDLSTLAGRTGVAGAAGPLAILAAGVEAGLIDAAATWARWEAALTGQSAPDDAAAARSLARYRIQAHYLRQHCFLGEQAVLDAASSFVAARPSAPVIILHGRQDLVCRPVNAWRLHERMPRAELTWVDGAGHDPFAAPMADAWRESLARLAQAITGCR